jgi:hypothetical protein
MRNFIILLILLFIFSGGCASKSLPPQKDPEFVKRLNQINELLDEISADSYGFTMNGLAEFRQDLIRADFAKKCKLLIENPDIALPLMFERLDNKELVKDGDALRVYFVVFGKTKSAESIPYIADYLASKEEWNSRPLMGALWAAQEITSFKLIDERRSYSEICDQRSDIAQKLRQWYEEHKK